MAAGAFLLGDVSDIRSLGSTPYEGVGRWDRMGPEMVSPLEGGMISRENCSPSEGGMSRPEDSGVRWLDGLRSRKVG